jgi:uncharacterized protein YbaP (TraB family)
VRRLAPWLAALAALLAAGCARAEPPLWVVRDADSELVLFGAVHVLPPGLDWRRAALDRAVRRADDIWFELPAGPDVAREASRAALHEGLLPPGERLSLLLTPEDAARLARVARLYGVDPASLDAFRPWFAEQALAAAVYARAQASVANGVETTLLAAAPARTARRAFETPSEQIGFFAATPLDEQVAALNQTVRDMEGDPDEFALLVQAWMAGDLDAIDRLALAPLETVAPTLFRRLVVERNARWAAQLDARLKGRGRTVVVVGLGHLVGPEGLPQRLRALGYTVKGP